MEKVAPFLLKLYEIVSSPASDDLVCWSEHGETFKIVNRTKFAGVSTAPTQRTVGAQVSVLLRRTCFRSISSTIIYAHSFVS